MGIIAERCVVDECVHLCVQRATGLRRFTGLIARPVPEPGTALRLTHCRSVHGFGMAHPLDVIFVRDDGVVTSVRTLSPWRCVRDRTATDTYELRAGEARRLRIEVGSQIKQLEEGEL